MSEYTVKELIEELNKLDPDSKVGFLRYDLATDETKFYPSCVIIGSFDKTFSRIQIFDKNGW